MPQDLDTQTTLNILKIYKEAYCEDDEKDTWFQRIKDICPTVGCTENVKEYKKTPEKFNGHVGDVSTVIRYAVTSRKNTPDLYSIMKLLGRNKVLERIDNCIKYFGGK